jgi:hypothetical protein
MVTKINELEKEGEVYEIECVVKNALDIREVVSKKGDKLKVQNIDVVDDDTENAINLRITLWNEKTGKFNIGDKVKVKGYFEKYKQYYMMRIPREGYIKKI